MVKLLIPQPLVFIGNIIFYFFIKRSKEIRSLTILKTQQTTATSRRLPWAYHKKTGGQAS